MVTATGFEVVIVVAVTLMGIGMMAVIVGQFGDSHY
jgi:hypothetical protein